MLKYIKLFLYICNNYTEFTEKKGIERDIFATSHTCIYIYCTASSFASAPQTPISGNLMMQ